MRFSVLAILMVVSVQPIWACDLCSLYSAQEAQDGGKGFFSGVAEQFTYFDTYQSDGHTALNPDGELLASLSSQIFAGYNFNQRIGVQFNLPIIYRDYRKNGAHGSEAGLGDVSLIGNFRIYRKSVDNFTFIWTALGGIKFPTGDTSKLGGPDFATGIGGHDLTLGSGSVDGLVGTGFSLRWGKLFLNGNMQYAIRTEGDYHYQFANDWNWSGGPGIYLALEDNYTVALQAAVSGESKGQDTENGVPTDDTAVTIVYLGPQISFTWSDKLSAHIGADLPVSIASSGNQLVPDYRIHAAVTWRF
jgi:hypothetical protein